MKLPVIQQKHIEYLQSKIKGQTFQNNLRASSLGWSCDRKHFYDLTLPRPPHSVELEAIFGEGNVQEQAVIDQLRAMGFIVEATQEQFKYEQPLIMGHIDGKIGETKAEMFPFDVKSASPWSYDEINSAEDLIHSRKMWHRLYPVQILFYMLVTNSMYGVLIFKNKQTGMIKDVWFSFDEHIKWLDEAVKRAERVYANKAKGYEGDRTQDLELCQACPHKETCLPDIIYKEGIKFIESPELVLLLETREANKEAHKTYEKTDKRVKDMLKSIPPGEKAAGEFMIQIKEISRDGYTVEAGKYNKVTIVKTSGEPSEPV